MTTLRILTLVSICIAVATLGCEENTAQDSFAFEAPVRFVSLNTDFGNVAIAAVDSGDIARVSVDIACRTSVPEYDVYVEQDVLMFSLEAGSGAHACEGEIEIEVPADTAADIRTSRGNVVVNTLHGPLKIVSFDGDITLNDVRGELDATAVSGDITGSHIASNKTRVTIGAGNADLTYASEPAYADIDVLAGNAQLVVPIAAYNVEAAAHAGHVDVTGISCTDDADRSLLLAVESGDINVYGR
ncbi:MAG: DUF4097 family beta strand repeat-containing protein [Myxococcota bacterium]|nr:DUF4097 family beta strand repeat-containing protein [Myxococcota bacterium]